MATAEHFTVNHKYFCRGCDDTFEDEATPRRGYWFTTSNGYQDEDGDSFIEGETKVLIGKPGMCCHSDDPCFIGDDDWAEITCEGYRCTSCGSEYMWDNDDCSDHDWATGGGEYAKQAAEKCCGGASSPDTSDELAALATPRSTPQKRVVTIDL